MLLVALVCALGAAVVTAGDHDRLGAPMAYATTRAAPDPWRARYREAQANLEAARRTVARLRHALRANRRVLLRKPQVVEAINLACVSYGWCSTLWRRARCETGGTFDPHAYNASSGATGLFQFLPSTWRSTPYRHLSIVSPYANALAAGWMHAHGRSGEWACP